MQPMQNCLARRFEALQAAPYASEMKPAAQNKPEMASGVSWQSGGFTLANPASLTSASRDRTRKAWTWA